MSRTLDAGLSAAIAAGGNIEWGIAISLEFDSGALRFISIFNDKIIG